MKKLRSQLFRTSQAGSWSLGRRAASTLSSTTTPATTSLKMLRGHIADQLYKRQESYFSRSAQVARSQPLDFSSFFGERDYRFALHKEYETTPGFLTPVEIFKPTYSEAIGSYIVKTLNSIVWRGEVNLVEVGAGTGTNMRVLLDFLKREHRGLYDRTRVTIIDVSKPFTTMQRETLKEHLDRVEIFNESIFDWKRKRDSSLGFVIALELLDNLPHDKLVFKSTGEILETRVQSDASGFSEQVTPISDLVVTRHLSILSKALNLQTSWDFREKDFTFASANALMRFIEDPSVTTENFFSRVANRLRESLPSLRWQRSFYIPTGAQLFLESCSQNFPRYGLILADFDSLPGAMPGVNGPLVQQTKGNTTVELASYLKAELGAFDILFPTNFEYLHALHRLIYPSSRSAAVMKSSAFMRQHANLKQSRTTSGYNPLLSDFVNTGFLVAEPVKEIAASK